MTNFLDTYPDRSRGPLDHSQHVGKDAGKGKYAPLVILCALCLVLFFFRLGVRPLWDVDEGMHAATSKDMVLTGDWVTPKMNGENFYDKTPLYNWFAAAAFLVLGFTEFAARLPAAALGLGTVLVTYLMGRRLFGPGAGLMGGVVLATSPEVIVLSRAVVHDISLAFFITLALFFFYASYSEEKNRRRNLFLFYGAAGFAVLAKGPIGILLPGMIIGLFLLVKGRINFLKEMSLGWGALIFLLVAAPWYVLISVRNPDYISYFILKQNLGNFLSKAQAHHPQPFYYYVPVFLGGMLPWSFFLPLACLRPLSKGLKQANDGVLFLVIWFLAIFLFFSAANSKLGTYILPAFPAAALLIGWIWHEMISSPTPGLRRSMAWSLAPLPILFLAGTLFIMLEQPVIQKMLLQYGITLYDLNGLWAVITGIFIVSFFLFVFRHYRTAFSALAVTFVIGILIVLVTYIPKIDPFRSTKGMAREMDTILPPGEKLVFYHTLRDSALFYTNRLATVLNSEQQLLDYLASDKRALCVIDEEQYDKFERVVHSSSVLHEEGDKLLISNMPM
ncbi:MAG TPA: glycosyltransferase family 39 protein [Nitrospirota bacterium]|nr:glycosyltransferase family 39 protein [Nitrospirota bacterium]